MIRLLVTPSFALLLVLLGWGCAGRNASVSEGTPPPPKVTEVASEPVVEPVAVQVVVPQPKQEEPVAAAPERVAVRVSQDAGNLDTVFFDYDSSVLTPEALRLLNRHVQWLQENQEVTATIEGHCDERGSDEYNLALGERRATVARDYLVARGITPGRLAIVSYGEQRPATGGHDETAWEKNRRVEFR